MAEGLAKIEGMLAGRIADREAVEGINADLAGKKAGLAATIEGMGAVAFADMEAIKAAEELANEAQKKLNALQSKAAKEKAGLIGMESANAAGKGDVLLIMDDIAVPTLSNL